MANNNPTKAPKGIKPESKSVLPLTSLNFKIMIIAGVMIVAGFLLMLGGSSTPEQFNPDIFSTRRIVIGPLIAFIGFIAMGAGIIINPSRHDRGNAQTDSDDTKTIGK